MAMPLVVGLLGVPALLCLSFAVSLPNLVVGGLMALPMFVGVLAWVAHAVISGLGAVQGVNEGSIHIQPVPLASLDERIARLTQMREWLQDDALRVMVDDAIGRQVKLIARRQVAFSFTVGVTSLIVGWLLSAVSPVATLTNLLHR
jgi:hypothetical protein